MKQQVFVIHGGEAHNSHGEYIAMLFSWVVSLDDFYKRSWKKGLQEKLGEDYEVFNPQMPNVLNAKYSEWKIWFEKYLPLLQDGVIFVGHSLGGIFLAKYFSENNVSKKIKAIFFVAAPCNTADNHPLADFVITNDLKMVDSQCPQLFFYHSKDDKVVPFSEMERYRKLLPEATFRIFDDRGHFNMEEFPEIVEDIRGISP